MGAVSEQKPGRYPRTTGGLVASILVLVLGVGAFVVFRSLFRDQTEYVPPNVDYLSVVQEAADAGIELVHPTSLPAGWKATAIDFTPGDRWVWNMSMLTDTGKFVGIHEEDAALSGILSTYVDDDPRQGDPVTVTGSVASTWDTYSDSGGDHAFVAEVGQGRQTRTVLVYGSAPVEDLRLILDTLAKG